MPSQFDFITTSDKPALVAIDNPELLETAKAALNDLGYKIHAIDTHEEFPARFSEVQYQVVIIDETFGGLPDQNPTLVYAQELPMQMRRHAVFLLIGPSLETLNAMQAFQQSVHCVVNYAEMALLPQLIQKVIADNNLFLENYRETSKRVAQSRLRVN